MLATHPPHPSDGPPVRVHLTAATLDAAAAVCEVRGLPHLVARIDRAANGRQLIAHMLDRSRMTTTDNARHAIDGSES